MLSPKESACDQVHKVMHLGPTRAWVLGWPGELQYQCRLWGLGIHFLSSLGNFMYVSTFWRCWVFVAAGPFSRDDARACHCSAFSGGALVSLASGAQGLWLLDS